MNRQYGAVVGHCHLGPVHVFDVGKAQIWAGRNFDMDREEWGLRIRLDNAAPFDAILTGNDEAKAMMPGVFVIRTEPTIRIEWPDMSIPELSGEWWDSLVLGLNALPEPIRVGVWCVGGHGRTGTFLSILAGLAFNNVGDPVAYIRKNYCEEAVETQWQIAYIEAVTGLKVKVASSIALSQKIRTTTGFVNSTGNTVQSKSAREFIEDKYGIGSAYGGVDQDWPPEWDKYDEDYLKSQSAQP